MDITDTRAKAARIKDRVSMADVIARYHRPGRRFGRTPCPFHGGEHDNLGYDKHVFHCFVCGAKGDVIDFTKRIHGTDFPGAMRILDTDFGLGLESVSNSERRRMRIEQRERESAAAKERERRQRTHKTFVLFTRIMHWIRGRELQTPVHTAQWEHFDRQTDMLLGGGNYAGDPKAAARAAVQRVREAEKEMAHGG